MHFLDLLSFFLRKEKKSDVYLKNYGLFTHRPRLLERQSALTPTTNQPISTSHLNFYEAFYIFKKCNYLVKDFFSTPSTSDA